MVDESRMGQSGQPVALMRRSAVVRIHLLLFTKDFGEKEMKLDVKKDRNDINKIIENVLPLMKMNKNLTQDCADCIILYFIEKKEETTLKEKRRNLNQRSKE